MTITSDPAADFAAPNTARQARKHALDDEVDTKPTSVQLGQHAALLQVMPNPYRQNRELRLKRQTGYNRGSETVSVRGPSESRIEKPAEFRAIRCGKLMLST
jgi:hypothetical protein